MRAPYSVSFTFFRSFRLLATSALMTSDASERDNVSTPSNSPSLSTGPASSSPGGGGLGRDVGAWGIAKEREDGVSGDYKREGRRASGGRGTRSRRRIPAPVDKIGGARCPSCVSFAFAAALAMRSPRRACTKVEVCAVEK